MSSRIELYQNSIKKFTSSNSVVQHHKYKQLIFGIMDTHDFIVPISLLTIMNGQTRKNKFDSVSGYDMALGIELLLFMLEYDEHIHGITKNTIFDNFREHDFMQLLLLSNINQLMCQNMKQIFNLNYKSDNNVKNNVIWCIEKINAEIPTIVEYFNNISNNVHNKIGAKLIKKTDLKHFNFSNPTYLNDIRTFRKVRKDLIISYTTNTYCKIISIALMCGWIFGGGSVDMVMNLERLGYHFGILLKISNDFTNIEKDIKNVCEQKYTFNYVVNHGLQDAFELFDECKKKFFEGVLTLNILSPTIKEIISMFDNNVSNVIEHSSPDLKQSLSSTSSF